MVVNIEGLYSLLQCLGFITFSRLQWKMSGFSRVFL